MLLAMLALVLMSCTQEAEPGQIEPTGEVKEFFIVAKNWEFSPPMIKVNAGDTVKLHVNTIEGTHGFLISEFGINRRLEPGEEQEIVFMADKKGNFSMVCSVYCGSGHEGMRGVLVVE